MPRMAAESKPECSATLTPSSATNTVPKGANPVKLVTSPAIMRCKPSALNKLTTSITPSASRPGAPTGRGSIALNPNQSAIPLNTTIATANIANSVIG